MKKIRIRSLLLVGLPLLALVLALILLSPAVPDAEGDDSRPSTFSTDSAGTQAVFLVMKELLPSAERWLSPLSLLPDPVGDAPESLLILGPLLPLGEGEAEALDRWIQAGGQLILAGQTPWQIQMSEYAEYVDEDEEAEIPEEQDFLSLHGFVFDPAGVKANFELEYRGPGGSLLLRGKPLLKADYTPLFSRDSRVVGGEKSLGKGRIVFVSDPEAWSNARLARSHNSSWLVLTALGWGNGRLLVDEYHLGFQEGRQTIFPLLVSFLGTAWGAAFIQLAAAGALFLAARMRRFGPVLPQAPERAHTPMERAAGIGAFLEAAKARSFAARTISQLLSRRLSKGRISTRPLPPDIASPPQNLSDGELVNIARSAGEIMEEQNHARRGHP